MAKVLINNLHTKTEEKCRHGDFVICGSKIYIIAPFEGADRLCLVCLNDGCTRDREVNVSGLTPQEMAREHCMDEYIYVHGKKAVIDFWVE